MKLQYIDPQTINCRCRAGADLTQAVNEAIALSIEQQVPVVIDHNDRIFTADPRKLRDLVYKTQNPPEL